MKLCDVSNDVLLLIFRELLAADMSAKDMFRQTLGLLDICRRLRCAALPVAYECIFIHCDDEHGRSNGGIQITTNLDLAVSAGCVGLAKRVQLHVGYHIDPLPSLRAVCRMLGTGGVQLEGVGSLEVTLESRLTHTIHTLVGIPGAIGGALEVAGLLADALPGIHRLVFDGRTLHSIAQMVLGQLASKYAEQLQELETGCATPLQKLHFPNLEALTIRGYGIFDPFMRAAVLPSHMKEVNLTVDTPNAWALPTTRRLKLSVDSSNVGVAAASRMVDAAAGSKNRELYVEEVATPFDPDIIRCSTLTRLDIMPETDIATILEIIEKLPLLVDLRVYEAAMQGAMPDLAIPGPNDAEVVEPLETKLERLTIYANPEPDTEDEMVVAAKYFLLRVPSMVKFSMPWLPPQPMLDFIDEYAPRYPHLATVVFSSPLEP
ncbi:hypothetical protein H4R19_002341 [Coemansia spiralis]|nr:hypothetical protein H4R19_002341 [Coemansia spiralis]